MIHFDKIIWRDTLTLIDFFAQWCGPCQQMHTTLDLMQRNFNGRLELFKIDIDSPDAVHILRRYEIRSVPTMIFFRRGEILWRHSGMMSYDSLVRVIERLEAAEYVPHQ